MNKISPLISLSHRGIVSLKGTDALSLLQGLVTNDMDLLKEERVPALFTAWLSPQGRFWYDFFVIKAEEDTFFLTPEKIHIPEFLKKLQLYKLRKSVTINDQSDQYQLVSSLNGKPDNTQGVWVEDPRTPRMGWIGIVSKERAIEGDLNLYDTHRILENVPDGSRDLEADKAIILENNYDDFHGISWNKGCYMGQELMARTHHRGLVRKKLTPVHLKGSPQPFGTPLFQDGEKVGAVKSSVHDLALALLRIESIDRFFKKGTPITAEDGTAVVPNLNK
jgi:folate-binding protein YgfZ